MIMSNLGFNILPTNFDYWYIFSRSLVKKYFAKGLVSQFENSSTIRRSLFTVWMYVLFVIL